MNKKRFLIPLAAIVVILTIVMVACGAKPTTTAQNGSSGTPAFNGTPGGRNLTQPLPLAEDLVVGTFKLSGTPNALTQAQAASLIPLWQAYAQLTSSNTAAQAEIDAVVSQIQQTMTPQQDQAITAMKLTRQDLFTTMSGLGLTNGFGSGNGTPGANGTPRAPGGGGGFFGGGGGGFTGGGGGGFPGGGGFGGGGGVPGGNGSGTRPTPNPTQLALRAQFANRIPSALMTALITSLQKIAGTTS